MATSTLYRPVGQPELDLIAASDWRRFPPRLDWQPIFYPVTNEPYATRIARDWNTKDDENGNVGYVLRFEVNTDYLSQFDIQQVGDDECLEYWIPAEQLGSFNNNIVGEIEVVREYREGPRGSQLLITDDICTPPPAIPIGQMTETEYRRFVNMMLWLVRDEAEPLRDLGCASIENQGGKEIAWGPWSRHDCAELLLRWFEAGLLEVHRFNAQLSDDEARELLVDVDAWAASAGKAEPFIASSKEGATRPDPFWFALVRGCGDRADTR